MISSRPGCARQRRQRRGDLVGIVREIVDHGDAAGRADRFEPALEAGEAAERGGRIVERNAERMGRAERGQRIQGIVAAGDGELDLVPLVARARA